jgi:hypothetical protein
MRYDAFIIWGNGVNHIAEIMTMIRNDGNYNIVRLIYRDIDDMEQFIKDIYACDTVPWPHLVAKSKYLLDSPPRCVFVLVENMDPREKEFGAGTFRHIQCENIKDIKNKIRSLYNPRFRDGEREIPPLPRGVSHDHCIHATDYQSQVEYLLDYFKLNNLDFYRRYEKEIHYIPWHLNKVDPCLVTDVRIDDLLCNIRSRLVRLEETPHYQYVRGDRDPYIRYFDEGAGKTFQEDHFAHAFDNLIKNYDERYTRKDGKQSLIIIDSNNIILDGVHRASILKNRGKKIIKCLRMGRKDQPT